MDDENCRYIVMDYIRGKTIDHLSESECQILANVLNYFKSITANVPGSLGGGPSKGLVWPDTNDLTVTSLGHIEGWYNSRLFPGHGHVKFNPSDAFVLCHLDIAPRNIISMDNGHICLVDWASAGFYPRLLEYVSLSYQEANFSKMLLDALPALSTYEEEQHMTIRRALFNN